MLDIRFIRENADAVKAAMANRNAEVDLDAVLVLDHRRAHHLVLGHVEDAVEYLQAHAQCVHHRSRACASHMTKEAVEHLRRMHGSSNSTYYNSSSRSSACSDV